MRKDVVLYLAKVPSIVMLEAVEFASGHTPHGALTAHLIHWIPNPMKTIQVYDPPMCCSTGICGTDIDPDLVSFASMLSMFGSNGIKVERFNLGQQPMAFVENPAVKALLESDGAEALPLIFWDGELYLKGRYPTKEERPAWYRGAKEEAEVAS